MILVYSGHGGNGCVWSSDVKKVQINDLHSKFSGAWKGKVTTIPRLFIMDCCRGSQHSGAVDKKRANGAHKAGMISTLYGNSPGIEVSENKKGGYFTQVLIDTLRQNKDNKKFTITHLSIAVLDKLQKLSDHAMTCWKEGDPRCDMTVFNMNG